MHVLRDSQISREYDQLPALLSGERGGAREAFSDTLMRRGIDEADTRELVSRIKEKIPGCALRTTMLVGFPGETDADFELLLDFAKETRFARLGGFVFSPEDRSIAARLPDQAPVELARERMARLLALQERIMTEDNQALTGQHTQVLVEGLTGEGLLRGRTRLQAPEVDGEVFLHEPRPRRERSSRVRSSAQTAWTWWRGALSEARP